MQTVSPLFEALQKNPVRKLTQKLDISFDKQFDPSVVFFVLDQSVLDGPDILAPEGDQVITEWQKYLYENFSDRVIGLEWTYETSLLTSIASAMADITLNNYDNYFTRGGSSPIDQYLVPRRPLRIQSGFNGSNIPQFVGLTETAPAVDRSARTAKLHALDFLSYIFSRKLDRTVMLLDQRVDEIISYLFQEVGVLEDQMQLDVARTVVPYAFFDKDRTLGSIVNDLMKAEMGSLYMDETGIIVFKNRLRASGSAVATFDETNIIDYDLSDESTIINSVTVKSTVRKVQPNQIVFTLAEVLPIGPGETLTKFFQFDDPVTGIDTVDTYTANAAEDGSAEDMTGDVTVTNQELFGDSLLVEFENTGPIIAYLISLTISGTPAQIVKTVDVLEKDQDSIDAYEEQTYSVDSIYIQSESAAQSIAETIVHHFKDYGNTINLLVKSNPALQLDDVVHVTIDNIDSDFRITKKTNVQQLGSFTQRITAQKYDIPTYFTLDVSELDGPDVLAA